jgi:hypothetical protein
MAEKGGGQIGMEETRQEGQGPPRAVVPLSSSSGRSPVPLPT